MRSDKTMIYFLNEQERFPITYSLKMLIRRAVVATLEYEDFEGDAEVSLTFTDNEGIRVLNAEHRDIDRPTDVLSFPLNDPDCEEWDSQLGDVVISLERAAEQAEEFGHGFSREVAFLTVHSMLHLLGYDHVNSEAEDAEMRRRQREILEGMGLRVK
jgi:probable rRNA maturation factor